MKQYSLFHRVGGFRALVKAVLLGLLAACAGGWLATPVCGATRNWTGNASVNWSDPNNWNPLGPPQDGDVVMFSGAGLATLSNNLPNLRLNSIVFGGFPGGFVLTGNPVQLDSNITDNHSGGSDNQVLFDIHFTGGGQFSTLGTGGLYIGGSVTLSNNLQVTLFAAS